MSTTLTCAHCGASFRPDQGWCSVCFTPAEVAFDPLTAPLEEVEQRDVEETVAPPRAAMPLPTLEWTPSAMSETAPSTPPVASSQSLPPVAAAPMTSAGASTGASTGPTTGPTTGPLAPPQGDEPESEREIDEVDVMLSMLAAEHRQSDPAAALADRMGDRSVRMLVMVGGMAVVALVGFLGLTALGLVF